MGGQDKRELAIQEYAKWLGGYRWDWFGTLKITSGIPSDGAAKKMVTRWISELGQREGGRNFRWACVLERGALGNNRHLHVLVGGLRNRRKHAERRWRDLGGDALIDVYDSSRKGILYMLKSMGDNGDLEIDLKLPDKPGTEKTAGKAAPRSTPVIQGRNQKSRKAKSRGGANV